jgi:hypothetical protein
MITEQNTKVLPGERDENRPLERPKRRWEDLKEKLCEM